MEISSSVLVIALIIVCVASAVMDFRPQPHLIQTMQRLKVPTERLPLLGAIKCAAAVGLAIGWVNDGMAVATGACLSVYFAVATMAHVRVRDAIRDTVPAFVLLVVSMLFTLTTIAK